VITVEAQHEHARLDIEAALFDLLDLLRHYGGGHAISAILDVEQPTISGD
jgi:hypothetical protein